MIKFKFLSILALLCITASSAWGQNQPTGVIDGCAGYNGSFLLNGWAWDEDTPNTPITVHVYVFKSNEEGKMTPLPSNTNVQTNFAITADKFKQDLLDAGKGNGYHSFDGTYHELPAGTWYVGVWGIDNTDGNNQIGGFKTITVSDPFAVTYNANGGSGSVASQDKCTGIGLELSDGSGLTRTGYTFDGWATSADGAVAYAPGATYTGNANLSLYAHWTAIAVTGVSLDQSTLALSIGGSETLTATVSPTDALNKTVEWTSSNSAVATVSTAGLVTAVNAGTCTVTATTDDGNFKATCTVTVTDPSALTLTGDNEWTLAAMPAYDIELSAEYYTDLLESNDGSWLASNNGQVADLWLGRTLQPGSYNTLALPFSMTIADFKAATGDNAILVKQLTEASVTGTTLNLTFSDAESITANTPYLVKLSGSESVKLEGFDLVTVSTADGTASFTDVSFIPTLSRTQVAGNVQNILFLGADNELLNPSTEGQYIKGFRAYFQLKGAAAGARSFVLDFGDGEMTGIQTIRTSDQPAAQQQGTYDLQGRRVNGQPTQKGIYIVNGKKTIIK